MSKNSEKLLGLFSDLLKKIRSVKSDQSYYHSDMYGNLKNLEVITILVSDYDGNKTKYHTLNLDSLKELILLLEEQEKNKHE